MKKRLLASIFCLLALSMLLTGCDSGGGGSDDDGNNAPVIADVYLVRDPASYYEPLSFSPGEVVYIRFIAKDVDKDIKKAHIVGRIKSTLALDDEAECNLPEQSSDVAAYYVSFIARTPETYLLYLNVEDKKGNKSNIISKTFKVE